MAHEIKYGQNLKICLEPTSDGCMIFPPGCMINTYTNGNPVTGSKDFVDPRKIVFPDKTSHDDAVLIFCREENKSVMEKTAEKQKRQLFLFGRGEDDPDAAQIRDKFDDKFLQNTRHSRATLEKKNDKVGVQVLPNAREMTSIYTGDPIAEEHPGGKQKRNKGCPKVILYLLSIACFMLFVLSISSSRQETAAIVISKTNEIIVMHRMQIVRATQDKYKAYSRAVVVIITDDYTHGGVFVVDQIGQARSGDYTNDIIHKCMEAAKCLFTRVTKDDAISGGGRSIGLRIAQQQGNMNNEEFAKGKYWPCTCVSNPHWAIVPPLPFFTIITLVLVLAASSLTRTAGA